jgi:hypothetical protein
MYPFESLPFRNGLHPFILLPSFRPVKPNLDTLFAAILLSVAPGASAAPSCHIPGGRTIAAGSVAKLISVPTPSGSALFACMRRSGRKLALDDSYSNPRLSGRWVAWERKGRPGRRRIAVEDLRSRDVREVDGHVAARSLRLTARGTIVWAQRQESGPETPLFSNDVVSGGRLLDGGAVDPASVKLEGRHVRWISGGEARSAVVR